MLAQDYNIFHGTLDNRIVAGLSSSAVGRATTRFAEAELKYGYDVSWRQTGEDNYASGRADSQRQP